MSQFQPPYDMNYASGPVVNPRPGSITALSIIAIVVGSLFLLCNVLGLLSQVMLLASSGKNPFVPNAPAMTNQGVSAFNAVAAVINLCLSAGLLAGGIGGLMLRPWARRMMIA